jgi:hypothetical protein
MTKRLGHKRKDKNQGAIVAALEGAGCLVFDLSEIGGGCPDILVARDGVLYLLEIKNPETRWRLTKKQEEFHKDWAGWPVFIVETSEEALAVTV